MESANNVSISMRKETLLVIFEFLARSYDSWSKSCEANGRLASDGTFALSKPDLGELAALWYLEGEIQRTLPEIFSSDYSEILSKEKQRLRAHAFGEEQSSKVDLRGQGQ